MMIVLFLIPSRPYITSKMRYNIERLLWRYHIRILKKYIFWPFFLSNKSHTFSKLKDHEIFPIKNGVIINSNDIISTYFGCFGSFILEEWKICLEVK